MFLSWGGISGGQFTLLGMLELALEHQIPFETIAEWTAAAPAKRFGLQKKGGLRRGVMQISCSSAWSRTLLQENRCLQSIKKHLRRTYISLQHLGHLQQRPMRVQ